MNKIKNAIRVKYKNTFKKNIFSNESLKAK